MVTAGNHGSRLTVTRDVWDAAGSSDIPGRLPRKWRATVMRRSVTWSSSGLPLQYPEVLPEDERAVSGMTRAAYA